MAAGRTPESPLTEEQNIRKGNGTWRGGMSLLCPGRNVCRLSIVDQFAQEQPPLVIPKPDLSARNLLPASSEAADSARGLPRFGVTILWGFSSYTTTRLCAHRGCCRLLKAAALP